MHGYSTWRICFIRFRVSSWDGMAATNMASMLASYLDVHNDTRPGSVIVPTDEYIRSRVNHGFRLLGLQGLTWYRLNTTLQGAVASNKTRDKKG